MQKIAFFFFFIFFSLVECSYAKDEYFRTLRFEKVNLRQGPAKDYPVKIFYKKKFLPVLVQDSLDNFRKIRDHHSSGNRNKIDICVGCQIWDSEIKSIYYKKS